MNNNKLKEIVIDLEDHYINLIYRIRPYKRTLFFSSKSREFYLALITLIVIKMKEKRTSFIYLKKPEILLILKKIDMWLSGAYKSKQTKKYLEEENRLEKIRKAWAYAVNGLKNLKNGSRFQILGHGKTSDTEDPTIKFEYKKIEGFEEDIWDSLIHYEQKPTNYRYSFAVENVGLTLDDVSIQFKGKIDGPAWENYLSDLEGIYNEKFWELNTKDYRPLQSGANLLKVRYSGDEGVSFRRGGPLSVDFENEFVAVDKAFRDNVINRLGPHQVVLLLGAKPASGKSFLARAILNRVIPQKVTQYLRCDANYDISNYELITEKIEKFSNDHSGGILIVEDAHINPGLVEYILKYKNDFNELNILITSREINSTSLQEYFSTDNTFEIEPSPNTVDSIIEIYVRKNLSNLKERIDEVKESVNAIYKQKLWKGNVNLWLLLYALKSIRKKNKEKSIIISKQDIIDEINKDIENISNGEVLKAQILILLSVLFRFELQTDVNWIVEYLAKNAKRNEIINCLQELCRTGEIVKSVHEDYKVFYGLQHSALAELYYDFCNHPVYFGIDSILTDNLKFFKEYILSPNTHNYAFILSRSYHILKKCGVPKEEISEFLIGLDKTKLSEKINNNGKLLDLKLVLQTLYGNDTDDCANLFRGINTDKFIPQIIDLDTKSVFEDYILAFSNAEIIGKNIVDAIGTKGLAKRIRQEANRKDLLIIIEYILIVCNLSEVEGSNLIDLLLIDNFDVKIAHYINILESDREQTRESIKAPNIFSSSRNYIFSLLGIETIGIEKALNFGFSTGKVYQFILEQKGLKIDEGIHNLYIKKDTSNVEETKNLINYLYTIMIGYRECYNKFVEKVDYSDHISNVIYQLHQTAIYKKFEDLDETFITKSKDQLRILFMLGWSSAIYLLSIRLHSEIFFIKIISKIKKELFAKKIESIDLSWVSILNEISNLDMNIAKSIVTIVRPQKISQNISIAQKKDWDLIIFLINTLSSVDSQKTKEVCELCATHIVKSFEAFFSYTMSKIENNPTSMHSTKTYTKGINKKLLEILFALKLLPDSASVVPVFKELWKDILSFINEHNVLNNPKDVLMVITSFNEKMFEISHEVGELFDEEVNETICQIIKEVKKAQLFSKIKKDIDKFINEIIQAEVSTSVVFLAEYLDTLPKDEKEKVLQKFLEKKIIEKIITEGNSHDKFHFMSAIGGESPLINIKILDSIPYNEVIDYIKCTMCNKKQYDISNLVCVMMICAYSNSLGESILNIINPKKLVALIEKIFSENEIPMHNLDLIIEKLKEFPNFYKNFVIHFNQKP